MPHTDFIFSAFAEEHGFVGVVVVLALYFLLLMQIVQNAQTAPDRAGMYICMGVAAMLLFHVLVNVGMVVGTDAGDRDSAAADECRRFQYFVDFLDAGAGEQCPASEVCELSVAGTSPAGSNGFSRFGCPGIKGLSSRLG